MELSNLGQIKNFKIIQWAALKLFFYFIGFLFLFFSCLKPKHYFKI